MKAEQDDSGPRPALVPEHWCRNTGGGTLVAEHFANAKEKFVRDFVAVEQGDEPGSVRPPAYDHEAGLIR
jgi:hypothetical protein